MKLKRNIGAKLAASILIIAGVGISSSASALELDQVSARAGTLGLGAEAGFEVIPTIVARVIAQKYDYNYNNEVDGISYDGQLKLGSYGLQVDLHPPLLPIYATAGIYKNQNKIDLKANPAGTYDIGGTTYTGSQVGTLTTNAEFKPTALYGGLGLEFQIGPLAVVSEAGVFYQGKPDIKMTASGPIATNPAFQNSLATESGKVKDELDKFQYWPALTIMGRLKF